MIHTFGLSTHHTATHHSGDSGVAGFVESSLKKLWNAILYGAGHHIGYELAWVIAAVAVAAGLWLLVQKRRKKQATTQDHDAAVHDVNGTGSTARDVPPSGR